MAQVTTVALSLHEAAEALREYAATKLNVPASGLLVVEVCSYGRARLTIEYDQDGNHFWKSLECGHRTHNGVT